MNLIEAIAMLAILVAVVLMNICHGADLPDNAIPIMLVEVI
jgi:hypothetical protein